MDIIFVTAVIVFIQPACSQTLSKYQQCFSNGDKLVLNCETTALNQSVLFNKNGVNQGGCDPFLGCGNGFSQSGTTTTSLTISDYNETINSGSWTCTFGSLTSSVVNITANPSCPISQMSTSISTMSTTSVNSVFELSNITIHMITVSITPTSGILALTTSYVNTGSKTFNAYTESTYFNSITENFYNRTETTISNANTESKKNTNIGTTNFYANTQTSNVDDNTKIIGIQTTTLRIVTTTSNYISGSSDTINLNMNETLALPSYSMPSHSKMILQSLFETSNVFPPSFSVTSVFHNLQFSSVSPITADSPIYPILSLTISSLMSTTLIDKISYSSTMEDPSLSTYQYLSETNTLITYFLDEKNISFVEFSGVFQTFSRDYATSASTSLAYLIQSTEHQSSLQPSKNHSTMQKEFTSIANTSFYDSRTAKASTWIYSQEIMSSSKYYMLNSLMSSQTQLVSMNDIQDLTTDVQSTYVEPYFQPTDEVYSSDVSEYLFSTLQQTHLLLPFNTIADATKVDSYMTATNSLTSESQFGILTVDLSLFTNPSLIQISTVLPDFETTWYAKTINYDSKDMSSMITPSSQRTNSDNSYNVIGTSFKDLSSFINSFSESVTSRELLMTTLSSKVIQQTSTMSTSTIQSGLSEKNKTIIFISTTSAVVTIIVVILLMIFAKLYMSKYNLKHTDEGDNISWSNKSIPPWSTFPDYSVTGKRIYPLLNTSSTSFKMHHYEHNWNDIV